MLRLVMNHDFGLSFETPESSYPLNIKLELKAKPRQVEDDDDYLVRYALTQDLTERLLSEMGVAFDGLVANPIGTPTSVFLRNAIRVHLINDFVRSIDNAVLDRLDNKTLTSYSIVAV